MFDFAGLVAIKKSGDQKSGDLNRQFAQYVKHPANAFATAGHMIRLRKIGRPCARCRTHPVACTLPSPRFVSQQSCKKADKILIDM